MLFLTLSLSKPFAYPPPPPPPPPPPFRFAKFSYDWSIMFTIRYFIIHNNCTMLHSNPNRLELTPSYTKIVLQYHFPSLPSPQLPPPNIFLQCSPTYLVVWPNGFLAFFTVVCVQFLVAWDAVGVFVLYDVATGHQFFVAVVAG